VKRISLVVIVTAFIVPTLQVLSTYLFTKQIAKFAVRWSTNGLVFPSSGIGRTVFLPVASNEADGRPAINL
jgi:hypothetical protein